MTPTLLLAFLCGLALVGGLLLMVAAWVGWDPAPRTHLARRRPANPKSWTVVRWPAAVATGLVAWALVGWPALGLAVGAAVIGLPIMFSAAGDAAARIDRVEAVAEWTRRLAGVLAVGMGLEQAILAAARTAPDQIRVEVGTLAARIAARTPTEVALRGFADELGDPTGDLLCAALILASRRRGPGVAAALTAVADSAAEEVTARRRVEADRAKPRATARAVTLIMIAVIAYGVLNTGYTAPYATSLGQLVLTAMLGFFAAALWWMHSMTITAPQPRLLPPAGKGRP